ncbi:MAG: TolC family protein [Bdellovibrionaceae bacterium]|nr:TolC family protein [Pseudobdellovibrionaceae bacterium]
MVKRSILSIIVSTLFVLNSALAEKVGLTQNRMAELIIQKSLNLKEADLKYEQYRYAPFMVYGAYEWKWSVESRYEVDKSESLALIGDYRFERYRTTASITKSLLTGTALTFDVSRVSQIRDGDSFAAATTTTSNTQLTYDTWGVSIQQSLWGNSFGSADRARVRSAENLYKSQMLMRSDEIQNLVLQGLRLYWDAYVAQENFNESMSARDRYQKLVGSIQRKSSLGYTMPGELNQVQAEYEARQQSVKAGSQNYLKQLETLVTFLNLPAKTEIQFEIPKAIPPIPKLAPKPAQETRFIQSQDFKIKSAEDDLNRTDAVNRPNLDLIARLSATGVDESSAESLNELTRGSHPNAYVGLRLSHAFGSDVRKEEFLNKKASLELEKVKQQRNFLEFEDRQRQAQRKVEVAFQLLESIGKQKGFWEKALNELNRSYTQGRTDIRNLIEVMNSYNSMEVQYSRAVGDYFIALNEWAALRDELIKDEK